jgi:hypothetical protein
MPRTSGQTCAGLCRRKSWNACRTESSLWGWRRVGRWVWRFRPWVSVAGRALWCWVLGSHASTSIRKEHPMPAVLISPYALRESMRVAKTSKACVTSCSRRYQPDQQAGGSGHHLVVQALQWRDTAGGSLAAQIISGGLSNQHDCLSLCYWQPCSTSWCIRRHCLRS